MTTIQEALGVALGCVGISMDDFCAMTPEEFGEVYRAWAERETEMLHGEWERTRVQAAISVQPHLKKALDIRKLLPFPWDGKAKGKKKAPESTRARFDEIVKRTKAYGIDH